uniref:Uncharacterized protein n=1 Tax=Cannabis sativa TaxID=3483 RepID=A0A803NNT6_CANSA
MAMSNWLWARESIITERGSCGGRGGIVGNSLAEILPLSDTLADHGRSGVARRPQPTWNADHPIHYIRCDVLDPNRARQPCVSTRISHSSFWALRAALGFFMGCLGDDLIVEHRIWRRWIPTPRTGPLIAQW